LGGAVAGAAGVAVRAARPPDSTAILRRMLERLAFTRGVEIIRRGMILGVVDVQKHGASV